MTIYVEFSQYGTVMVRAYDTSAVTPSVVAGALEIRNAQGDLVAAYAPGQWLRMFDTTLQTTPIMHPEAAQ